MKNTVYAIKTADTFTLNANYPKLGIRLVTFAQKRYFTHNEP